MRKDKIKISDNSMTVLKRRYLRKDKKGEIIESPEELFERVANHIANADKNYGADDKQVDQLALQFYDLMSSFKFLPNSPTLMNAGRSLGQLSACFVLPVGDSMEEIFETNKQAALIHKSGGGTGFSFSRLRPRDSVVQTTSGVASGPVSFMGVFDSSTEAVKQGGTRRGANMGILRVDHPDILEFISCKDETDKFVNFNISVAVTDAFMKAVETKEMYPLFNPHTNTIHKIDDKEVWLDARDVFERIVDHAWKTGEPGVIFLDRMNERNPNRKIEIIEATNPCGEQPLPPYDSCNLGSINLSKFVSDGEIDYDDLRQTVYRAVHFLDNVIDQNKYPINEIKEQSQRTRRIGLGVMGWADLLVKMNISYDSEEAFELAENLFSFIETEAKNRSSELSKARGNYPDWENSVYKDEAVAMRNTTVTTIAPTGTISIIAGCSSGIEPYYAVAFERNVMDGTRMVEINPIFEEMLDQLDIDKESIIQQVVKKRSVADIDELPEDIKRLFKTAADISYKDHIRMQAKFQKYCDSSVSKTINFPEEAKRADVGEAFWLAYQLGCKGITVYRDNSRPDQVLSVVDKSKVEKVEVEKRPSVLHGITEKIRTGYGNLYVTINVKDGRPFEVFAHIGKSGYSTMADTEAICRLISLSLRSGVDVMDIIKQLRGIGGSSQIYTEGTKVFSIPDAIAQILNKHFSNKTDKKQVSGSFSEICPSCSSPMRFESGCFNCASCGYSNC